MGGKIKPGLRMETVNGASVAGLTKKEVVTHVKASIAVCTLTFTEDPAGYSSFQSRKAGNTGGAAAPPPPPPVAGNTPGGGATVFASMGRLQVIKFLKSKGVDYSAVSKDIDALRTLANAAEGGGGGDGGDDATYANEEYNSSKPDYAAAMPVTADYAESAPAIDTMGRLQLIKLLKSKGIDYSAVSKDIDALRGLARGDGYGVLEPAPEAEARAAPPAPTPAPAAAPAPPAPAPAGGGDDYDGMGRLSLIKLCKERSLAYQSVAKDVEGLKALLRS